jgi:predicted TIM-barrel fold metal-dependent hydrolase
MNIYFDTSLGSPSTIQMFISEIGPERVIFGSDMPFGVMKSELMKILNLNLNERDVRKILEDNITSLTGI